MSYKFLSTILGIDANFTGNVGVGTTTPAYKLDVNGTTRVSSSTAASSLVFTSTTSSIATASVKVDTIGGFFRAYGSAFSVASLASKVSFGPDGADGIVVFSNATQASGSTGSISLRGGGYDSAAEMLFIDQNGSRFTNGYVLIGTSTNAGYKLDVNGTIRSQGKLTITTGGTEITGTAVLYSGAQSYGQVQIFSASAFQMFNAANNSKASFQYINANGLLLTTNSDNISGVLKGLQVNPTMVAAANNDVLVGLDITPTFTNGAFTGVSNIGLRVRDNNSGFDQIITTRTLVTIGNTSNQSINAVNTQILTLPKSSGGGLIVQSNNSSTFGLTESPFINFNNVNSQTFARLNAVGTNGNSGRLEIGVAQPSTSISSGAFFYAAANRGTTQFALGSDFTDNSRAVIVSHWDGASALILKPNASTTTAPTFRVRNNADSGDNFLVYGATGNVGINVSSDAGYKLDVNGTARIYGASTSSLMIDTVGTADMASSITFRQNSPNWSSSIGTHTSGGGLHYGLQFKSQPSTVNFVINRDGSTYFGGFGLANSSSLVELSSTTKGFLQPRMTTTQRNAIATPATGLSIYNTTTNTEDYYNGSAWVSLQTSITNPVTGTGTTNYVPKWTGSTALGNSLMYDNGTTLLVGTTTASTDYSSALLALSESSNLTYQEIRGSSQATLVLTQGVTANSTTPAVEIFNGYNFGIKFIGGTGGAFSNYPLYYYAGDGAGTGDYVMMQAGGSERLRIASNGNVQIGTTTNAGYKLDINGTARVTGAITTGITGTAGTLNLNRSSDGANVGFVRAESSGAGIQIGSGVNMFFSNNGRIVVNSTTTDASAIFKIDSSTQGFLPPRMTSAQRTAISTPAVGLIVYQTDSVEGIYVYTSGGWKSLTMV